MSVDISAEITRTWPTTETKLSDDSDIDYATQKNLAISRAKRALYGNGATIPAEADIPETAAYWIADKAVLFLIPTARSWYTHHTKRSDAKEGATITYHDALAMLDSLERELTTSLAAGKTDALDAISSAEVEDDVPAVSVAGLAVDPLERAMERGPW
jgi:hypothetical protein